MRSVKYLSNMVAHYLPRGSKILQVQQYYESPSVLEVDIDEDGHSEILVLYEKKKAIYIGIYKNYGRYLEMIWNSNTHLEDVAAFQLLSLGQKGIKKYILLGGRREGQEHREINLLEWQGGALQYMLLEGIPFDKVYTEDLEPKDGIDEIIIWTQQVEEAYDVTLYVYHDHKLVETDKYDKVYFKTIQQYYKYLCESYPEKKIYQDYLQGAIRKCGDSQETMPMPSIEEEVAQEKPEKKKKEEEILIVEGQLQAIIAMTGMIAVPQVEEDLYFVGKWEQDGEAEYIAEGKIIYTTESKQKKHIVVLPYPKIYSYRLFVGDFTGNGTEDLLIQNYSRDEELYGTIYSYEEGELRTILALEEMNLSYYEVRRHDTYDIEIVGGTRTPLIYRTNVQIDDGNEVCGKIGRILNAYPVDENSSQCYLLYCTYPIILCSAEEHTVGYLVRCLRWDHTKFSLQREYVTDKL